MYGRRLCSRAAGGASKELKKYLHKLYKVVHPDRFAGDSHVRKVNERSFQQLQEALSSHFKEQAAPLPKSSASSQPLVFFAHGDVPGTLRRASVEVGHSSNTLIQALPALFAQLGLDPPPVATLHAASNSAKSNMLRFKSITTLARHAHMQAAASAAKRQERAAAEATDAASKSGDAEVLRLALERAHGLRIIVSPSFPRDSRLDVVITRLRDALRDVGLQDIVLNGAVIEIDPGFDVDILSNIPGKSDVILGACARREQWDQVLTNEVLYGRCAQRRRQLREIRKLERKAAATLKVRIIMHDLPARMQSEYRALLKALVGLQNEYHEYADVVIMLVEGNSIAADVQAGVLRIGIDLEVQAVHASVVTRANSVAVEHRRIVMRKAAQEKELAVIKSALRLGGIRRAAGVEDHQWAEFVNSMRDRAARMRSILHGARVEVVKGEPGITADGEIRIPWDFAARMQV